MIGVKVAAGVAKRSNALAAALDLQFTSKYLDPKVTFSRASLATMMGQSGLLEYAPHNLFTYSEQFDNAAWSKTSATITANVAVAPDGTTTADKWDETAVSANHQLYQYLPTTVVGIRYTQTFRFKAAERTGVRIVGVTSFTAIPTVSFDLVAGTYQINANTNGITANIADEGGGWYACTVSAIADAASSAGYFVARLILDNATNYLGEAGKGVYIWGAQANQGSLQDYNSTTPKNLLGYTDQFDTASWIKARVVPPVGNVAVAPDGSTTAEALIATSVSGSHYVDQTVSSLPVGSPHTVSVYVKKVDARYAYLYAYGTGNAAHAVRFEFDTQISVLQVTAEYTSGGGTTSAYGAVDCGGGWWRLYVSGTPDALADKRICRLMFTDAVGATVWAGDDTTAGVYAWGAQVASSASLDPYVRNSGAAPVSAVYYGPRIEYDTVTGECKGLLIEESRTNLLTYSDDLSDTYWNPSPTDSVIDTVNATLAPDGTMTAEKISTNDLLNNGHVWFRTFTGAINTTYVGSMFLKAGEYTRASLTFGNTGFGNVTTGALFDLVGGTVVAQTGAEVNPTITPVGNGWYRCSISATSDADGGAYVFGTLLRTNTETLVSSNFTPEALGLGHYIWGAQVEAGAFPTSYIPTVASSVTRAADSAIIDGTNFSGWFNASAGTVCCEYTGVGNIAGATRRAVEIGVAGSTAERFVLGYSAVNTSRWLTIDGSVSQADLFVAATQGALVRTAGAYAVNDFQQAANGVLGTTDTVGTLPTVNALFLGNGQASVNTEALNGHIRRFTYYNTRLPNATLQELTR